MVSTHWNLVVDLLNFWNFQFSAYFLSNMILQCMTIYLYWEKPVWLWCQYWIWPNIAANTKSPGVSQNHEKSSYQTNCHVFINTVIKKYPLIWDIGEQKAILTMHRIICLVNSNSIMVFYESAACVYSRAFSSFQRFTYNASLSWLLSIGMYHTANSQLWAIIFVCFFYVGCPIYFWYKKCKQCK